MAATVLPQLEEIISSLSEQETSLSAELAEVQSKLEALRSVTSLFDGDSVSAIKAPATAKSTAKSTTTKKTPAKKTAAKKTTAKAKTKKTTAKAKTTKKSASKSTGSRKTKKDGRAATWQKYARAGVTSQPMPEAVRLILETQPDKDFKIAEVMSSLFKDDMPKAQYLKARNRISNILSGGVRNGDWFKGDRGAYRLTAKR